MVEVSDEEFRGISDTTTPQGILLVVEEPSDPFKVGDHTSDPLWVEPKNLIRRVLLLDGIQDPGNAGTLLRAAWGFGIGSVAFLDGCVDPWSPKVVRAGAGAHFHLEVVRRTWDRLRAGWASTGVPLLVADSAGEDLRSARRPESWALVVGNEGAGVRREIREASSGALAVPIAPGVDSLNAGVAGAILLFVLSTGGDFL
jgi:TrmH family RNA methyltransferase